MAQKLTEKRCQTCQIVLNRYWKVLQNVNKKHNITVIKNYIFSIDSEYKMDNYFKPEGQCQGHKISINEIVKNRDFQLIWSNF